MAVRWALAHGYRSKESNRAFRHCAGGHFPDYKLPDHLGNQRFRASVGAEWTFLSDPGRIVQKDLDIPEYTDPEHNPMIPYTLVLKPGLVVYSIYDGY